MSHVFDIHNEFGRLFDEQIYKRELARRFSGVALEVPVKVTHSSFAKTYYSDTLVHGSGLFEFKAVEPLHPRHRGQTRNYLLLFDLGHGKVVNLRPERVEHEFVNCPARLSEHRMPMILDHRWVSQVEGAMDFRDCLMALINDWGAGLESALYEEALCHFLRLNSALQKPVSVFGRNGHVGDQAMCLMAPDIALRITGFPDDSEGSKQIKGFETQSRKLLKHTPLKAMHWANITHHRVTFITLS
jgi:GxxExxY protein